MKTIGDRIKDRRIELGLSQEDLARRLGYKSRSSINKIELDGQQLPQTKIADFARALYVSPSYLMGWDEGTAEPYYADEDARELAEFLYKNPEYGVLFKASRNVKKEDLEVVKTLLDRFADKGDP